jgi:hypothetical protein
MNLINIDFFVKLYEENLQVWFFERHYILCNSKILNLIKRRVEMSTLYYKVYYQINSEKIENFKLKQFCVCTVI